MKLCGEGTPVASFDLREEEAWCTSNLYKKVEILQVCSACLMGIYSVFLAIRFCIPKVITGDQLNESGRSGIFSCCMGERNALTPQRMSRFAALLLLLQVGVAAGGGWVAYRESLVEVTFALSGLLGWLFAVMSWVVTMPKGCNLWIHRFSLILLPPATVVGLVAKQGQRFPQQFIFLCILVFSAWSLPCYLMTSTLRSVIQKNAGGGGKAVTSVSIESLERYSAGLAPVFSPFPSLSPSPSLSNSLSLPIHHHQLLHVLAAVF